MLYNDSIIGLVQIDYGKNWKNFHPVISRVLDRKSWIENKIKVLQKSNIYPEMIRYVVFHGIRGQMRGMVPVIGKKFLVTNYAFDDAAYISKYQFASDIVRNAPANARFAIRRIWFRDICHAMLRLIRLPKVS